jgi:rare lipoprotein A
MSWGKTKRSVLFSGLAAAALALSACSTPTHQPVSVAPHTLYKVGEPYQINGIWYYPAEDWSYDETGIASWYGEDFHGKYTANGEVFDLNGTTAAHRTLPLPSVVQVTNLDNGRTIQVRVNDRGPFARGRILDLSRRAAQLLGFEGKGTAKVRVKILVPESIQAASLAGRAGPGPEPEFAAAQPKAAPVDKIAAESLPTPPGVAVASTQPSLASLQPAPTSQTREVLTDAPPLSDKVTIVPVKPTQIYVQAGAFASMDRAWRLKVQLDNFGKAAITDAKVGSVVVYRVRLGPMATVEQADAVLDKLGAASPDARIVVN